MPGPEGKPFKLKPKKRAHIYGIALGDRQTRVFSHLHHSGESHYRQPGASPVAGHSGGGGGAAMERYVGRVAVVTGVSSGIGEGLVRALVAAGVRVAGCARNADKLQVRQNMARCVNSIRVWYSRFIRHRRRMFRVSPRLD